MRTLVAPNASDLRGALTNTITGTLSIDLTR